MRPAPALARFAIVAALTASATGIFAQQVGEIATIVGNGQSGSCPDFSDARTACLNAPTVARVDLYGNLLIADTGNALVRVVPAGMGVVFAATPSLDAGPDLLPLPSGEILIASRGAHVVYKLTVDARIVVFAGTGIATGSIDGEGRDPSDDVGDGGPATAATLNAPSGLARDLRGNIFIADSNNHRIRRIDASGIITTVAGAGTASAWIDGSPGVLTDLWQPYGLAFDRNGELLVSERAGHRVRRVIDGADGVISGGVDEIVSTIAGGMVPGFDGDGGPAVSSMLTEPAGVAVDLSGNVYIADSGNHAIRRVSATSGVIDTIAGRGTGGDGPAVDAQLATPLGLHVSTIDSVEYLYVADAGHHMIRRIALRQLGPNGPPLVSLPEPFTVGATSSQGALVTITAEAQDPDGDALTGIWSGPTFEVPMPGVDSFTTLLPIGTTRVTLTVNDGHGHVVAAFVDVTVSSENHSEEIVLTPRDESEIIGEFGATAGHITIAFRRNPDTGQNIVAAGDTSFRTRIGTPSDLPSGRQFGSPPYLYDVGTTAQAAGTVEICIDHTGMSFVDSTAIRLLRRAANGGWSDATTAIHSGTKQICSSGPAADAFGTYAIVTPADPASAVTLWAGTAWFPGIYDGQGGDPRDDINEGGPATASAIGPVNSVAFDQSRGYLYIGERHGIRRVDRGLPSNPITTIAGTGLDTGSPTDGVDARLSEIGKAAALALDREGDLFVADATNCAVRRLDVDTNVITTIAGRLRGTPGGGCAYGGDGGAATDALLDGPVALVFDHLGNLYIADHKTSGGHVRRVAAGADGLIRGRPEEVIITVAGNGTSIDPPSNAVHPLASGINPFGLAFNAQGDLYLSVLRYVRRITPGADGIVDGSTDERITNVAGVFDPLFTGPASRYPFLGDGRRALDAVVPFPTGMLVLPSGDLLVIDTMLSRVRRIRSGADGVVGGATDEMIDTVAGFAPPAGASDVFAQFGTALATVMQPASLVAHPDGGIIIGDYWNRVLHVGLGPEAPSGADLMIEGAASVPAIRAGQTVRYSIRVTNRGPSTATGISVGMPVPAGVFVMATSQSSGFCLIPVFGLAGSIACAPNEALAPGQFLDFTFDLRPTATGTLDSTITVAGAQTDYAPGNNVLNLSVTVTPNQAPIANAGPDAGYGADTLAGALVRLRGTGSDPDGDTVTLTWTDSSGRVLGTGPSVDVLLPPGDHIVTLTVSDGLAVATDTVRHLVAPTADLRLTTTLPQETFAFTPFTIRATVFNAGPFAASHVAIEAVLPLEFEFINARSLQGPCALQASTVRCRVDSLPSGADIVADIDVRPIRLGSPVAIVQTYSDAIDNNLTDNVIAVAVTPWLHFDETIAVTDTMQTPLYVAETIVVEDTLRDLIPPVVTPPDGLVIIATEPGGARGNVSSALHDFLLAGSAVDNADPNPVRLAAAIGDGVDASGAIVFRDVDDETLFPIGVTTVYFRFRDAANNVGTAAATLTVLQRGASGTLVDRGGVFYRPTNATGTIQPVGIAFGTVTQPGFVNAEPMANPPEAPPGLVFVTAVFDVTTTAIVTGDIDVCLLGAGFTANDKVLHFEGTEWVDRTNGALSTTTQRCARVTSLSPFVVARPSNRPPVATASAPAFAEATSPAGANVTLTGSGSDPDSGDTLSFAWTEGARALGTSAILPVTLAIGTHDLTFTVSDAHGATATSTVRVVVRDTTAPVVTPPAAITIPATEAGGTRASQWPALLSWLGAATAVDAADPAPIALAPQAAGVTVTATSLFPIGSTTVTFAFKDASGNTGTATAKVTVAVGTPRIAVRIGGSGSLDGRLRFVDLVFTNTGSGIARRTTAVVALLTSKGSGQARLDTPAQPITVGDLNPGASTTVRLVIEVVPSVKQLKIVATGAFVNVQDVPGVFVGTQLYSP